MDLRQDNEKLVTGSELCILYRMSPGLFAWWKRWLQTPHELVNYDLTQPWQKCFTSLTVCTMGHGQGSFSYSFADTLDYTHLPTNLDTFVILYIQSSSFLTCDNLTRSGSPILEAASHYERGLCSKILNNKMRWVELGIDLNKNRLKFARKPILLPEKDACPTRCHKGRVVTRVELSQGSSCHKGRVVTRVELS